MEDSREDLDSGSLRETPVKGPRREWHGIKVWRREVDRSGDFPVTADGQMRINGGLKATTTLKPAPFPTEPKTSGT